VSSRSEAEGPPDLSRQPTHPQPRINPVSDTRAPFRPCVIQSAAEMIPVHQPKPERSQREERKEPGGISHQRHRNVSFCVGGAACPKKDGVLPVFWETIAISYPIRCGMRSPYTPSRDCGMLVLMLSDVVAMVKSGGGG
jgi:hypothetical protein